MPTTTTTLTVPLCGVCGYREPVATTGRCADAACEQMERQAAQTLAAEADRLRADGYPHCAELSQILADAIRTANTWAPPAPNAGSTARFRALMQLAATWDLPLAKIRVYPDQPSRVICDTAEHAQEWAEALAAAGYAEGDVTTLVEVAS